PTICPEFGVALGDLDADGTPEIISAATPCTAARIIAVHLDGTVVWQSTNADGTPFEPHVEFGAPSIADLDGDGMAEGIVGASVIEHDGTVRWSIAPGAGSNCCSGSPRSPISAVYDVDADGDLEIVAGNGVWEADGTVLWSSTTLSDGYVAVA